MFDSADLDSAVEGIVDAIWFNQGQVSLFQNPAVANNLQRERVNLTIFLGPLGENVSEQLGTVALTRFL